MKNENKSQSSTKYILDRLLANMLGRDYKKIVNNPDNNGKCSELLFLFQLEEIKKCNHIFVPSGYNFENVNEPIYFCIKCGLSNKYPNNFASEEELIHEKVLYELFISLKDNGVFLDCFDNPRELMELYKNMKKYLPGLSDQDFIEYINSTFAHCQIDDSNKKRVK